MFCINELGIKIVFLCSTSALFVEFRARQCIILETFTIAGHRAKAGPAECQTALYGASGERHGHPISRLGPTENSRQTSTDCERDISHKRPGEHK